MNVDKIFDHVGSFGTYQFYVYTLGWLPSILCGIHQLANVFLIATPKHRCFVEGCDADGSQYANASWTEFSLPEGPKGWSQCLVKDRLNGTDRQCLPSNFLNSTHACDRWVWDRSEFDGTAASEFGLVCEGSWLTSLSQSVLMVGVMLAAVIVGNLTDRYGRRLAFLVIPPLYFASTLATAYARNYAEYVVLRFLAAFCSSSVFQTAYVLCMEFIGASHRLWSVQMYQVAFSIGECLLALVAFFLRDWRELAMALSLPVVLMLPYYWLLPESLSWCLSHNKQGEATKIITKVAKWNGKAVPDDLVVEAWTPTNPKRGSASILDLFRTRRLSFRTVNLSFNWLVNSLVYYGLSLSAGSLAGDTYVNFAALSLVEIPAVILCTVALQFFGRRKVLSSLLLLAGVCCATVPLLPEDKEVLVRVLATLGKSNIAASFALIYMYSAELYPTSLRNTGLGLGSMSARIGSIAAPFVASDLGVLHPTLPMVVFGTASLSAGFLTLALPETRGKGLPQTLEDAEKLEAFGSSEEQTRLVGSSGEEDRA